MAVVTVEYHQARTQLDQACIFFPMFSVDEPTSIAPVPFLIKDMMTGATLASGSFPAAARAADANVVALTDPGLASVMSFVVPASTVMQFAAVPDGGHAAMPNDGVSFRVSGYVAF